MPSEKCQAKNNSRNSGTKFVFGSAFLVFNFLLFAVCFSPLAVCAQTDEPPKDAAAPPLHVLSKDEKRQVESETNFKKRTQLSLDLMETRLHKAEEEATQNQFQNALEDLGGYQALLENVLNYLDSHDDRSNKVDYNFKRLEMGLRRVVPRLEILRRAMPFSYGYYVQKLQKLVREARAKAMEPLFDDTVVPERKP